MYSSALCLLASMGRPVGSLTFSASLALALGGDGLKHMALDPSIGSYLVVCMISGVVAHWRVRRYALAVVAATVISHVVEWALFVTLVNGRADAIVDPLSILQSVVFASPIAAVLGIPFALYRGARRRSSQAGIHERSDAREMRSIAASQSASSKCKSCGENLVVFLLTQQVANVKNGLVCPKCFTPIGIQSPDDVSRLEGERARKG